MILCDIIRIQNNLKNILTKLKWQRHVIKEPRNLWPYIVPSRFSSNTTFDSNWILYELTCSKKLDVFPFQNRPLSLKIFRDESNEDICVCPDFMTCEEEKESFAMEKEQMLHLIYGCGFVVFFIVLISEYFVNLSKCIRRYPSGVNRVPVNLFGS